MKNNNRLELSHIYAIYVGFMVNPGKNMTELSSLIDRWFDKKNLSKKRKNFDAFHNWDDIVGEQIAKNTEPLKIQNDVLVIRVKNSVWTQELQYLKPNLLEKIKNSFPNTTIKDLMFRTGKIEKR